MTNLLYLALEYDINSGIPKINSTNIARDKLCDILDAWIAGQMGLGKDESKTNERDIYHIKIELDLDYDNFRTSADTGNKSLTAGIILDARNKFAEEKKGL